MMDPHGACNGLHGVLSSALRAVPVFPSILGVAMGVSLATGECHGLFNSHPLNNRLCRGSYPRWGDTAIGLSTLWRDEPTAATLGEIHDVRRPVNGTKPKPRHPSNGERSRSVFSPCGSMSPRNTKNMNVQLDSLPLMYVRWIKKRQPDKTLPSRHCDLRFSFPRNQWSTSFLIS